MAASSLQSGSTKFGTVTRIAFAALTLTLAVVPTPSRTQQINYDRVIVRADQQRMLLEKMSKESILVTLQVDMEGHLKELNNARKMFNHIRVGLREGNVTLALPPTTNPDILAKLSLVDDLWPLFDNTVRRSVDTGSVGRTEIDTLAEMNQPLREALDDLVEAYQAEAAQKQLYSLRFATISVASQQRALTQKMAKEFLLIALGHEARKNKSRLKKSAALFAKTLQSLLNGDQAQKLMAPPTAEIRRQLAKVESLWGNFEQLVGVAAKGKTPGRDEILQMSELNTELMAALEGTLILYREL